jgi:hypothetical protein
MSLARRPADKERRRSWGETSDVYEGEYSARPEEIKYQFDKRSASPTLGGADVH